MARPFTTVLTDRQRQVLEWSKTFARKHGFPPTVREIGAAMRITPRSVFDQIKVLERKGYLKRGKLGARSLEFTDSETHDHNCARCSSLPIVGRIAAGAPIMAAEDDLGSVPVNSEWLKGRDCYVLRVTGDSMKDASILNGDLAIIRKQDTAENGDIVVALVRDEEATLKYFYREGKRVRLQPANAQMQPIYINSDEVKIQGKLVGVQRSYDRVGGLAR